MMLENKDIKLIPFNDNFYRVMYAFLCEDLNTCLLVFNRIFTDFQEFVYWFKGSYQSRDNRFFSIVYKLKDIYIGWIGLSDIDLENKHAVLDVYIMDNKYRINKYSGYAIQLLCDYAFKVLYLNKLIVEVLENNKSVIKLCVKYNMQLSGTLQKHKKSKIDNKFKNLLIYEMLKEKYKELI